jgi:DNA excision repair protein ERCC-2
MVGLHVVYRVEEVNSHPRVQTRARSTVCMANTDPAGAPNRQDTQTGTEWRQYFGFETAYENQADAIERAVAVGREHGYLAMEGPCGTGKTMAALTAAATLLREGPHENAVVVTPVKQQREQFVADLRTLNAGLDTPLPGVALTGKHSLCPYDREAAFPDGAGVHERCVDLRENTATLVETERPGGTPTPPVAVGGVSGEAIWWDSDRASALAREARTGTGEQQVTGDPLATGGAESPFPPARPSAETGDRLYCPFEADWYARNRGSPVGFDTGEEHVVTPAEYLPAATRRGTCPHRVMSVLLESASVVVANYNHLFDPESRPLLADALDSNTFLIVDEAHRLEERARELLSDRVGVETLRRARNDCRTVLTRARETDAAERAVRAELAEHDVALSALAESRAFYDDMLSWLDNRIERALDAEAEGWRTGDAPDQDLELPLRDPETVERDGLTAWSESAGYTGELWRALPTVGIAAERALDALGLDRTPVCAAVGVTLERWWCRDHARYLRELELEYSPSRREGWAGQYTAGLVLFECMPGESLRGIFDDLGGGILMSATLEPLDVFTEVSGLAALGESRTVCERSYGLPFPEDNRASWLVDATPFTAHNRGDPAGQDDPETWNRTRDEYAHALRTLARSPGNVLLAMPNYREAAWAGRYLRRVVEKPVLVDASSSFEETERLKSSFFAGEKKVLVTSVRGTLTEGVDYDGDKLHCCGVVGVPLVNIGAPRVRAVRRAYGDIFGPENAFEYALTVPAVRRARQALGRVVRGTDEVGVRALLGRRYAEGTRHSVHTQLSPAEREEFVRMTPEFLPGRLDRFWDRHGRPDCSRGNR